GFGCPKDTLLSLEKLFPFTIRHVRYPSKILTSSERSIKGNYYLLELWLDTLHYKRESMCKHRLSPGPWRGRSKDPICIDKRDMATLISLAVHSTAQHRRGQLVRTRRL
ncbi:Uncharacterized protein DAT39_015419, partial [Clarias magur]